MSSFIQLTIANLKSYVREPVAAFFTLAFPPMLLVLFGFIFGNTPQAEFGGRGSMDVSLPAYVGIIIVTVGLISIPIGASGERERGILRRYRATPLRPLTYIGAHLLTYFVMAAAGAILLVIVGELLYKVRFDGNVASVIAGFTLSSISFFALGYVVGGLAPTARAAQLVGMVLAYPMMFLSGATLPLEILPENVRLVANFIPLTHVVTLLRGLWAGDGLLAHGTELVVLGIMLVVAGAVSARLFRWE